MPHSGATLPVHSRISINRSMTSTTLVGEPARRAGQSRASAMPPLLPAIAATIAAIALSWLSGAVGPALASEAQLPQEPQLPTRLGLLGCQVPVPDLPPKDLSKLPEV